MKGCKRGPSTVLTEAEEGMLEEWAINMSKIGYGRTREQVIEMVKTILDKDGRKNPFTDNRPGRDWWYGFLRRHPKISIRSPEQLEAARASAWYHDFGKFLTEHDIRDPDQIWNADETGCPLCPKSGRVLAMKGAKDVYQVTNNGKGQITTLCAISAAGSVLPPMHVFAGNQILWRTVFLMHILVGLIQVG